MTCGICDNCLRDPASIITRDVTVESWRILKVVEEVQREGGRVTLANLADLVRGLGGGSFAVKSGKRKGTEKGEMDVVDVAGGKVEMSKDVGSPLRHSTAEMLNEVLIGSRTPRRC
jgi:ATP-dependent DNA helicase Q1